MEEDQQEEIETEVTHFIAHVPVPSQKEVRIKKIAYSWSLRIIWNGRQCSPLISWLQEGSTLFAQQAHLAQLVDCLALCLGVCRFDSCVCYILSLCQLLVERWNTEYCFPS